LIARRASNPDDHKTTSRFSTAKCRPQAGANLRRYAEQQPKAQTRQRPQNGPKFGLRSKIISQQRLAAETVKQP
jgi:hypothetical protein